MVQMLPNCLLNHLCISSLVALDNVNPATQGVNTNLYYYSVRIYFDFFGQKNCKKKRHLFHLDLVKTPAVQTWMRLKNIWQMK